ncbi:MAG: hypothetical protein IK012_00645 [Fibrobacter sp.]|uniref:hypothetical protein n=1 Tax=Fibrobacter sp. TaxID=35828 RepID=UPI0025B94197|nr:hypothetical protein [Fibrobacter sp.]MBR4783752.1 hypothetical protein [Fibrobacter sp.]
MDIERKKVESIGEFAPKTKATLAALLGVSAAFSISACASIQQKEDASQKNDSDGVANVIGGDIADSPYDTPLPSKTPKSSSSESDINVFEPLGGIVYIPDSTDMDSSKAGSSETSTLDLDEL